MEAVLTRIMDYLLTQSWQIAVVAVMVAAVSSALGSASAHARYMLWLIVLAKCLVPPVLTVPLAVLPQERPAELPRVLATQIPSVTFETAEAGPLYDQRPVPQDSSIVDRLAHTTVPEWLALGWMTGVSVLLVLALTKALRTGRWLGRERMRPSAQFQADMESLVGALGVRRLPSMWLVDGIGQPFVWGLPRGSIYLPADFAALDNPAYRRSVLMHELGHVLRFDALVNSLQILAQAIFWFHPIVWWANRKIRREREKCCDEMAIARLDALPKDYGSAIVSVLVAERRSSRPVPSLAVASPVRSIEDRIKTIMDPGRKFHRRPGIVATVAILLLAAVAVPTTLALTARAIADSEGARRTSTADGQNGLADPNCAGNDEAARMIPPSPRIDDAHQILLDCNVYELPADLKIAPAEGRRTDMSQPTVQVGGEYAARLQEVVRSKKGVQNMAAPTLMVLSGQEAILRVGSELSYTADYEEPNKPGDAPTAIVKTAFQGVQWKITADVVKTDTIKLRFELTESKVELVTHQDQKGREVQLPVTAANTVASVVTVDDGTPVVIDGLRSTHNPRNRLAVVMTPRIIRIQDAADTRMSTELRSPEAEPLRVVRAYVRASVSDQQAEAAALTNPLKSLAERAAELRRLLAGEAFEIQAGYADDKTAVVISTPLKGDDDGQGHLVFFLESERGAWLIDDMDFESPGSLEQKLARFRARAPEAKPIQPLVPHTLAPGSTQGSVPAGSVEKPDTSQRSVTRIFQLKYADCGQTAEILTRILGALRDNVRNQSSQTTDAPPLPAQTARLTIVPFSGKGSNQLVVQGGEADMQKAEALIKLFDVPGPPASAAGKADTSERPVTRIFALKYANCTLVAEILPRILGALRDNMDKQSPEKTGGRAVPAQSARLQIAADKRSNGVIVHATQADMKQVEALIEVLDACLPTRPRL